MLSMQIENLRHRETISHKLQHLIRQTEDIFLSFARDYPQLLKETEKSLSATLRVLACFEDDSRAGCRDSAVGQNDLSQTVRTTTEIIRETIDYLRVMEKSDTTLFAQLELGIRGLDGLDQKIKHIKEDSIEMELISLNAMTVALKAGASGRAFSFITEELKRLSAKIIELTDEVTGNGREISNRFSDLQTAMIDLEAYQQTVVSEVNQELYGRFEDFVQGISRAVGHLGDLTRGAETVKPPLSKIMELTQKQDIIRQSLEHVIISVDELREIHDNVDTETLLDELTFFYLMPQLCIAVLDEVEEHIRQAGAAIDERIDDARAEINKLDGSRNKIVKDFLDSTDLGSRTINVLHEESSKALKKMARELQEIVSRKHSLGGLTLNLLKGIQSLNTNFNHFTSLISRFQTIDVASRIEVAKNSVLDQMTSTVEEMTALTQRIGRDVESSYGITTEFLNTSKETIFQVREQFEAQDARIRRQESRLNQRLGQLEDGKNNLDTMIRHFSVFSSTFFNLFERSTSNFRRLDDVLSIVDEVRDQLRSIQDEAEAARAKVLQRIGRSTWELKNEKLQSIIERFTIFSHKKVAGNLAGFDVEDGVSSGEVTLF